MAQAGNQYMESLTVYDQWAGNNVFGYNTGKAATTLVSTTVKEMAWWAWSNPKQAVVSIPNALWNRLPEFEVAKQSVVSIPGNVGQWTGDTYKVLEQVVIDSPTNAKWVYNNIPDYDTVKGAVGEGAHSVKTIAVKAKQLVYDNIPQYATVQDAIVNLPSNVKWAWDNGPKYSTMIQADKIIANDINHLTAEDGADLGVWVLKRIPNWAEVKTSAPLTAFIIVAAEGITGPITHTAGTTVFRSIQKVPTNIAAFYSGNKLGGTKYGYDEGNIYSSLGKPGVQGVCMAVAAASGAKNLQGSIRFSNFPAEYISGYFTLISQKKQDMNTTDVNYLEFAGNNTAPSLLMEAFMRGNVKAGVADGVGTVLGGAVNYYAVPVFKGAVSLVLPNVLGPFASELLKQVAVTYVVTPVVRVATDGTSVVFKYADGVWKEALAEEAKPVGFCIKDEVNNEPTSVPTITPESTKVINEEGQEVPYTDAVSQGVSPHQDAFEHTDSEHTEF